MKRFLALLLLAGCDSSSDAPPPESNSAQAAAAAAAAELPAPDSAEEAARLQAQIDRHLSVILIDPASAKYANIRSGSAGAACGEVESKQPDGKRGGFRPFVVTPEGIAVISTAPRVLFDDPGDMFADFYIRWCASPQELAEIGPRITAAPITPPDLLNMAEPGAMEEPAIPPPPPPEPAPVERGKEAPAPVATPRRPKSDDPDDFSNAVLRPGDQPKAGN